MDNDIKRGIYEFHWELTGRCNLDCVYCYNSATSQNQYLRTELTLPEIRRLVKQVRRKGTQQFTLSGGEPLLRDGLFEILAMLKGCRVSILSNGKLVTEEFLSKLRDYPQVEEFKLSWDGFASHNRLRVGSDWRQVENAVRSLKASGYRVVINTIVLRANQRDIRKLYRRLVANRVDRWRVDMPFAAGRYAAAIGSYSPPDPRAFARAFRDIILDERGRKKKMVLEVFNLYKSEFQPTSTMTFEGNVHPCEYKRELLCMKPNGDVIFCPSLEFPMGNFREEGGSLSAVFRKQAKHPFLKLTMNDLKACDGCRYLRICGGGCRANSIYDFGTFDGPDVSACAMFPEWEKLILPILPRGHQRFFRDLLDTSGKTPHRVGGCGEHRGAYRGEATILPLNLNEEDGT